MRNLVSLIDLSWLSKDIAAAWTAAISRIHCKKTETFYKFHDRLRAKYGDSEHLTVRREIISPDSKAWVHCSSSKVSVFWAAWKIQFCAAEGSSWHTYTHTHNWHMQLTFKHTYIPLHNIFKTFSLSTIYMENRKYFPFSLLKMGHQVLDLCR